MASGLDELERLSRELGGARSELDDRLGIEYTEATADRVAARMPVHTNRQVYGVLHGGASCALAESIGSCLAAIQAGPGRMAVGIELNASHHRPATSGYVTAVATLAHAGRTLVSCDVVITDDRDRRVCTARVTSMLRDRPGARPAPAAEPEGAAVTAWLAARGADGIPHPGGTLLAHLERVHDLLGRWGARPALRLAGLCHACYGTDGFARSLGDPARRDELAGVVGEEAERLVYFYASCDRDFCYPHVAETTQPQPHPADHFGAFRDRFTGAELRPTVAQRRDFAELTVANELDIVTVNPDIRARYGPGLLRMFTRWRDLLSEPAWQAVRTTLP